MQLNTIVTCKSDKLFNSFTKGKNYVVRGYDAFQGTVTLLDDNGNLHEEFALHFKPTDETNNLSSPDLLRIS